MAITTTSTITNITTTSNTTNQGSRIMTPTHLHDDDDARRVYFNHNDSMHCWVENLYPRYRWSNEFHWANCDAHGKPLCHVPTPAEFMTNSVPYVPESDVGERLAKFIARLSQRYTVSTEGGDAVHHLTTAGAADEILTRDGATYEIRRDDDDDSTYTLWVKSINESKLGETMISSWGPRERGAAEYEIFRQIVDNIDCWGECIIVELESDDTDDTDDTDA